MSFKIYSDNEIINNDPTPMIGPPGPRGPDGPTGPTGPSGPTPLQSLIGNNGIIVNSDIIELESVAGSLLTSNIYNINTLTGYKGFNSNYNLDRAEYGKVINLASTQIKYLQVENLNLPVDFGTIIDIPFTSDSRSIGNRIFDLSPNFPAGGEILIKGMGIYTFGSGGGTPGQFKWNMGLIFGTQPNAIKTSFNGITWAEPTPFFPSPTYKTNFEYKFLIKKLSDETTDPRQFQISLEFSSWGYDGTTTNYKSNTNQYTYFNLSQLPFTDPKLISLTPFGRWGNLSDRPFGLETINCQDCRIEQLIGGISTKILV